VLELRFIPTCVGNMSPPLISPAGRSVHPHVCGEHGTHKLVNDLWRGSSPRVWGTFTSYHANIDKARFIPTCVGNIKYPDVG